MKSRTFVGRAVLVCLIMVGAACGGGDDETAAPAISPSAAASAETSPSADPAVYEASDGATLLFTAAAIGQNEDEEPGLTPGTAIFKPANPGEAVQVERQDKDGWTTVASGEQDDQGRLQFLIDAGKEGTLFRAVSTDDDGAPLRSRPTAADGWTLAWSDEFDGTTLRPEWETRLAGQRFGRRVCSVSADGLTIVKDGIATLQVVRDDSVQPNKTKECPQGQFLNAMIGTDRTKSFTYGTFAARIKFDPDQGQHGAFWLQGPSEIDVAEYFGDGFDPGTPDQKGTITSFIHYPKLNQKGEPTTGRSGGYRTMLPEILGPGRKASNSFNVYSVEWTPKEYIFRVNGVETFRTSEGLSPGPQFMILSLLSSDWELPDLPENSLPNTMEVDWVRVWQENAD